MYSYRRSQLSLFAVGTLALAGCYRGDFAGLACQSSQECGKLVCVDEICVDADPDSGESEVVSGTSVAHTTSGPTSGDPDVQSTGGTASSTAGTSTGEPESSACCSALDVLVVIDQSLYMDFQCFEETFSAALFAEHEQVYQTIAGNIDSFQVGFTTASILPGNPPECQGVGSLLRGKLEDDCLDSELFGKPYITADHQTGDSKTDNLNFLESVYCLLRVGTEWDGPQEQDLARPIQALLGALAIDVNKQGGCNEGFSRPEVPLLIVMMTNKDQEPYLPAEDTEEPYDWWQTAHALKQFDALEGQNRTGIILINTPDEPPASELCTAWETPRLNHFYGLFDGELKRRYDLCAMRKHGLDEGDKCSPGSDEQISAFNDFFLPALDEMICELCAP